MRPALVKLNPDLPLEAIESAIEQLTRDRSAMSSVQANREIYRLSEEELAVFDLLTKPEISLTKKEQNQVKKVARELLETLKREKLVLEWRSRQQSKADVRLTIEETLDYLPRTYTKELYAAKCALIYQHVFDSYFGAGRSIYAQAA